MNTPNIHHMTHQEKLNLTDADIERFTKLRCLEEGVKLIPNPTPPVKPIVTPAVTVYGVTGFSYYFEDQATAEKLVEALNAKRATMTSSKYDWNRLGSSYSWPDREGLPESFCVEPKKLYSQDQLDQHRVQLLEYTALKEAFDKDEKSYKNARSEVESIQEEFVRARREARRVQEQIDHHQLQFAEYVSLCEGDREKARQFYVKANNGLALEVERALGFYEDAPMKRENEEAGFTHTQA